MNNLEYKIKLINNFTVYSKNNFWIRYFRLMTRNNFSCCIFGGSLRDIFILGDKATPRDVDIVLSDINEFELFKDRVLKNKKIKVLHNFFGGLKLEFKNQFCDVWALQNTYALQKETKDPPSLCSLPYTTFLNTEAIILDLKNPYDVSSIKYQKFHYGNIILSKEDIQDTLDKIKYEMRIRYE
jgi:hypothetical protein